MMMTLTRAWIIIEFLQGCNYHDAIVSRDNRRYNAAPATDKKKKFFCKFHFRIWQCRKRQANDLWSRPISEEGERAHELTICKAGRTCLICELPRKIGRDFRAIKILWPKSMAS
ncbi:hypothetical protein CEXT_793441 [Caerostris extrusa]|uniref:Secreted protein n=1 Tax=Caerostris extrusa TaxID=172846 RepID=A0AAV4SSN0_CAEEX|nr:hypothetical protein CEXT_793441 [Caerostris extrusa]